MLVTFGTEEQGLDKVSLSNWAHNECSTVTAHLLAACGAESCGQKDFCTDMVYYKQSMSIVKALICKFLTLQILQYKQHEISQLF